MILNTSYLKLHKIPLLIAVCCIICYFNFAYNLERTEYIKLIFLYTGLFFLFYKLIKLLKHDIRLLTWLAFGFRTVFILAIPNLSQDFYRFIWDGRMILEGFNPYLFTPESFIINSEFPVAQAQDLYNGMGTLNSSHFTNYPPLNQLCFVITGLFAGKSILGSAIVLRLLIIAADFGTLYFGKKLLEKLKLPAYNIFWYILNPFIIIELTGNLHFEGIMIFFLVWSLYLLYIGKWQWAGVVLACSISVKLIPLIFLPLFFKWFLHLRPLNAACLELRRKARGDIKELNTVKLSGRAESRPICFIKLFGFYSIVGITTIALFLPFYSSEFVTNYTETVELWFQNFEFNASFYYLFREIGYWISGYNQIAIIGKLMALAVFSFVISLALFRKNNSTQKLIISMLLALTVYYFLSTTVHPWYVATLLFLSVFTNYKFPLVWSFMVVFSYLAYTNTGNSENLWIIAFEYMVVFTVFLYDLKKAKAVEN